MKLFVCIICDANGSMVNECEKKDSGSGSAHSLR